MQNYKKIYDYIYDYQSLVYDYYSKHAMSFLATYYHLDRTTTVWDDKNLMGGYYERIGDLSGLKWDKILLLPIFFPENINSNWTAEDIGYISETDTYIIIPDTYGFVPYPNDVIKFDQSYIQRTNDKYTIYTCTNVSKSTPGDKTFYKIHMTAEQSRTTDDMDLQVSTIYTFFDYTKNIYSLNDSTFLTKMMSKNSQLCDNLKNMYDQNTGLYFV
jgi:hypothetical protein